LKIPHEHAGGMSKRRPLGPEQEVMALECRVGKETEKLLLGLKRDLMLLQHPAEMRTMRASVGRDQEVKSPQHHVGKETERLLLGLKRDSKPLQQPVEKMVMRG
jgi:hypothetical protein